MTAETIAAVVRALELIAELHRRGEVIPLCLECMTPHPCATRTAVDEALEALR